jgi:DNA repair protein RecN (Recombination protein N)
MAENRGGALAALRSAKETISDAAAIDPSLKSLHQRLETAFYEIEDVADSVRSHRSGINFSPERLEEFEERLNLIHQLEKKYGSTIDEVLAYREESVQKLADLENRETDKESLLAEIRKSEQAVLRLAGELSEKRTTAAAELEKKIESVLHNLGMPKALFSVAVQQKSSENGKPVCGPYGFDSVEFLISANKGEKLKPLKNIASGGEISRIMLAIKSVLSESDQVTSLIFDEIDAGIGGEVAVSIGEHLHNLSKQKQVLCITHLASIAVRADNHIKIEKNIYDNRTVTECKLVEGEDKVREISRMLAGDTEGPVSLQHAQELLKKFSSV